MQYIGIDTGWSGAVVLLDDAGKILRTEYGFKTPQELFWSIALMVSPTGGRVRAAIECIAFGPKGGRKQMARFGEAYGIVQAALMSREVPTTLVRAQQWQREMLNKSDGSTPKARARVAFDRLFPYHTGDNHHAGVIDAALIAEWLRRTNGVAK